MNGAYSNKVLAYGNTYIGKSRNGLKIELYIRKSDGKIISAFPME
ncbi:EndoU domain-containing protein [Streptococcus sanguinis]